MTWRRTTKQRRNVDDDSDDVEEDYNDVEEEIKKKAKMS